LPLSGEFASKTPRAEAKKLRKAKKVCYHAPCQVRTGDLGITLIYKTRSYGRYETHVITNYTKEALMREMTKYINYIAAIAGPP
jgi:hypothetical protein